jgi:ZIP family zinc transporter
VVQHLAAGLLIGAVALELLAPVSRGSPLAAVIGVAAGLLVVLVLDAVSVKLSGGEQSGGVGLAIVVAVDLTIDGFLLGVAAVEDLRLAFLLAIGLLVEDFFTTLSLIVSLRKAVARKKAIWITAGITVAMSVGAVAGLLVSTALGQFGYHVVLAFGAVALLFLIIEELLREAHRVKETTWTTTTLFAGLLGFLLLHMLL